jgi:hypothetical protein
MKGMNKEIYSLQSLADKIRDQQTAIDAKFAEQKPVIDNLTLIWRTVVMAVVGATIIAVFTLILTFSIPSAYALGKSFLGLWSQAPKTPSAVVPSPQPSPMRSSPGLPQPK